MQKTAVSVNGASVRLTDERWFHIVENHNELAGMAFDILDVVAKPDFVARGWQEELIAARKTEDKHIMVVYKETTKNDGFIITAFIARKVSSIKKRGIIWSKQS